jgi:hypothetical protein
MLADLLAELKQPSEALVEYEAVLRSYPNRFDALAGSAHAFQLLGDGTKMSEYCGKVVAISAPVADRAEVAHFKECAGRKAKFETLLPAAH